MDLLVIEGNDDHRDIVVAPSLEALVNDRFGPSLRIRHAIFGNHPFHHVDQLLIFVHVEDAIATQYDKVILLGEFIGSEERVGWNQIEEQRIAKCSRYTKVAIHPTVLHLATCCFYSFYFLKT